MRIELRTTFLIFGVASALFVTCLFAESRARSRYDPHAARLWNGIAGACLPIMIITLAFGSLGLADRFRERPRREQGGEGRAACRCADYPHLPLLREAITRRIRQTKRIISRLTLLETNSQDHLRLYVCEVCGQYWQTGHEWNLGDREYIFKVPAIESSEWLREPYRQPAAMLIFTAVMEGYFGKNTFEEGDALCREEGCPKRSMKHGSFCIEHHLEQLRAVKILPPVPPGRMFAPYLEGPGDAPLT